MEQVDPPERGGKGNPRRSPLGEVRHPVIASTLAYVPYAREVVVRVTVYSGLEVKHQRTQKLMHYYWLSGGSYTMTSKLTVVAFSSFPVILSAAYRFFEVLIHMYCPTTKESYLMDASLKPGASRQFS